MIRPGRPALARRAMLFVTMVFLGLAAGCSQPSPEMTTLRFWAMGREGEVIVALLPEFERTHPRIHVEVQQLPWTAAHEKLLTAFAGDSTPDICQLGNTWVPEFVALDAIEPLDPYVAGSAIIVADDYFPGIWDTNIIDRRLFGVPWYVDTRLLFYRRDLLAQAGFAAPPTSWQEWRQMLAGIKNRAGPDRYAILLPLNEFEPLLALTLQQDEPLLREGGRWGNFESDGFRRALRFYLDAFQRGWAPPLTNADISNAWNEFGRGYFAFYISGPWNIGEFKRRLPAEVQDSWMTAPLPGPHGPGASIAGGASLVLFRHSKSKAAAWQLIEYLSQPDVQRRFHELTGDLPPRRTAWSDERIAADVYTRAFREQLERVKPAPKVPEWERIANEMRLVTERAAHGELSVEQAARELDARADKILEKRRWMLARGAAH
ncbi:MAG: extracellular solute-binding protein [Betaproteobacteria bacterium]|nr:MAG: extracellular solute-binding protein [Betaproteobacteria bacterium]